jgi:hypothetical protein
MSDTTLVQVFTAAIVVTVRPAIQPSLFSTNITVVIAPANIPEQDLVLDYPVDVITSAIALNLSTPIIYLARQFITDALSVYIDEERTLKTLLNYGEDQQSVILAARPGNTERAIQLKLLQPVPETIDINTPVFLNREVAKTLIDTFRIRFAPQVDATPYLRPKNTNITVNAIVGKSLLNKTLTSLQLETGSFGTGDAGKNILFDDQIFRQWYSFDFNSAELNIDFTNYENFVFYSSAYLRLEAFKQKVRQIETLDAQRIQFISGSVFTGSIASAGASYIQDQTATLSLQKEDILRGFDRYEQYLYFTPSSSNSAYSASFDYVDGGVEYNAPGFWPKSGSALWPVNSNVATEWFTSQSAIAQRFDEFNENNLLNTIPTHIRDHVDNATYITFVSMVGHFFDTIKPYIDQYTNINSRALDPNESLSKDLVNDVADSLGFTLPTVNSLDKLAASMVSTNSSIPRRDYTAETYKRLLHNLPLFSKAKGTKTALDVMLRSLGIGPQIISIKEFSANSIAVVPSAVDTYIEREEYTNGLQFNSSEEQYIELPLSASNRNPQTLQLDTFITASAHSTLMTGDKAWGLYIAPQPQNASLGRLELISPIDGTIVTSSYHPVFDGNRINVSIRQTSNGTSLRLIKAVGADLLVDEEIQLPMPFDETWRETAYVHIGGSGSLRENGYNGVVDEVRLWNIPLETSSIELNAFDPGTSIGNTFRSPAENLVVKISFDAVDNQRLTNNGQLVNETPYFARFDTPSVQFVTASLFTTESFIRHARLIKQPTPLIGPIGEVTNKVKILPPPVFERGSISSNGARKLSRTKSIVSTEIKQARSGKNRVFLSMSPTAAVNNNIIRTIGIENINRLTSLPRQTRQVFGRTLRDILTYYTLFYKNVVDYNKYTRQTAEIASVVTQLTEYFTPAKANLFNGIVIEPNILERTRIPLEKNIRFYGKHTRKTTNAPASLLGKNSDYGATFNVSQTIAAVTTSTVSGSSATYVTQLDEDQLPTLLGVTDRLSTTLPGVTQQLVASPSTVSATVSDDVLARIDAIRSTYTSSVILEELDVTGGVLVKTGVMDAVTFTAPMATTNSLAGKVVLEEPMDSIANYVVYATQHISWESYDPTAPNTYNPSRIDLVLDNMNKVGFVSKNKGTPGAEPYNRLYTRKLFDEEINFPRIGGVTSINPAALYEIKPSTDFTDVGVTTFFNSLDGVYTFPTTDLIPTYPLAIDIESATTWSYGDQYIRGDVVYQSVTKADEAVLGSFAKASYGGNNRFYVFKTRPSYVPPEDGTAYYSGSVPSYTPPALDQVNWDSLRFTPIERRVPRRVVYDTFITKDPSLNNFKTTTIDVNQRIDIPARYLDTLSVPGTIAASGRVLGDTVVQNMLSLFALQASTENLRVRFYRTADARDLDVARSSTTLPTGSHGVLLDVILNSSDVLTLTNPVPILVAGDFIPGGRIYYTVDNLSDGPKSSISLLLYYYALHIEPRVPRGYLRKHYRFFRDTTTGTRRRSYLGCKNTIGTTVDGLPPVQVFIGEGNLLTVAPTRLTEEIVTGGGGTLDVT